MTGRNRIGAVLAATILLAVAVAAATRAQQVPSGAKAADPAKKELRKKLVELRTSVDLMQVEHDAAREHLLSVLRAQAQLDSEGSTPAIRASAAARATSQVMNYFLGGAADEARKNEQSEEARAEKAADEFANSVAEDIKQEGEAIRKAVDRATKKFTEATRRLHDKRLELADAEAAFARSR